MKIGIITFTTTTDNYGQALQAWALQRYLIACGHEVTTIRYVADTEAGKFKSLLRRFCIYKWIWRLFHLRKYFHEYNLKKINQVRDFDIFRNKNLKLTNKLYTTLKELKRENFDFDCFITGSDQVWAQSLDNVNNRSYFLDFTDKRKVSYAPSFAMATYPLNRQHDLSELLSAFDSVSCREKAGVEICRQVGVKATWVCDPVFLLESYNYSNLYKKASTKRHDFIYLYLINVKDAEDLRWPELRNISTQQRKDIVVTTASGYSDALDIPAIRDICEYSTIEQWLYNVGNADLVVTPSFHGIAFSILFNTPFVYIPLSDSNAAGNNRVIEILNYLGLENRILNSDKSYSEILATPIPWVDVNCKMEKFIVESKAFLNNSI